MRLQIIATRSCYHRADLEREVQDLGYPYEVLYVEEHPELCARYGIRHSPNLLVDGTIVCRGPIPEGELRERIEAARQSPG